ncbi:MAG: creatininase family protein [Candidatus Bathyarchaeota archaeon]
MTWTDVQKTLKKNNIILVPVGSFEQHGSHLPLETDTILATEVAERAARKAGVAVTPTISFEFSIEHMNFPGTISLRSETFLSMMYDISRSLIHHGFKKLVFVNAHGGNTDLIKVLTRSLRYESETYVVLLSVWELASKEFKKIRESTPTVISHAEEFETSLLLYLYPNLSRMNRVKAVKSFTSKKTGKQLFSLDTEIRVGWRTEDYSKTGVLGDPKRSSPEKGRRLLNAAVMSLVNFLNKLKDVN